MTFLSPLSPRLVGALALGVAVVSLITAERDVSTRMDELRRAETARASREAERLEPQLAALIEAGDLPGQRTLLERSVDAEQRRRRDRDRCRR